MKRVMVFMREQICGEGNEAELRCKKVDCFSQGMGINKLTEVSYGTVYYQGWQSAGW